MISVSFLGIKDHLKERLHQLEKMDISYFHCDIMDGKFVSEKTWSFEELKFLKEIKKPLDVHLMVKDIETYVESFSKLKPQFMTFHVEATSNAEEIIKKIHSYGCKAGISIKPGTPISKILPYLKEVDLVLVMSVEPGRGGQAFLPNSIEKIKELKKLQKNYHYLIEVDGGINDQTILECKKSGADIFVVGSFITNHSDYEKQIVKLKNK